ncbi:MAG: DNA repair protein RecO [Eubacterium sp.]|nr:DNA repair protein RecO [Candidatus Colimonas fimequi]
MRTDVEGIVLRRRKINEKTSMMTLFTKEFGKISAGTNLSEGRNRNQPALHAFTYGKYELNKTRENFFINKAEAVKSYYSLAENMDKYFHAGYVLEFTDKVLEEGVPEAGVYSALKDFFAALEKREKGFGTLVLAYQTKVLKFLGTEPVLDECAICGQKKNPAKFSIEDGGIICQECYSQVQNTRSESLIYDLNFDIVKVLKYFSANSLTNMQNIALKDAAGRELQSLIRAYAAHYLEASDLKSESMV